MDVFILAANSVLRFLSLAFGGQLYLSRKRLGTLYKVEKAGDYGIFRKTVSRKNTGEPECVLIVGFRLKFIGGNPFFHYLFQRLCILTTPFWSGFNGFRVKLWMVTPKSKNYLGIYKWEGSKNAQTYVEVLVKVLKPLSTKNSVWYKLYPNQNFESYLNKRKI